MSRRNISLVFTVIWLVVLLGCSSRTNATSTRTPDTYSTPIPSQITQQITALTPTTIPLPAERPIHFYLANLVTQPGYLYRSFLQNPLEMDFGPDGSLYIADWLGRQIVRVAPDGTMDAVETWRDPNFLGGGPRCIDFSPEGRLYTCDHGHIYRFNNDLTIESSLPLPEGTFVGSILFSPEGELFYTDRNAGTVMHWQASNPPDTVASGIQNAEHMAFGLDGTLYISQMGPNRVVKVDVTTGQVAELYAGELGNDPIFLTVDELGNIWIYGTDVLVSVSPEGVQQPYTVDGFLSLAPSAGIAFDAQGNLWLGSYQDWLWRLERTNPGNPTPNFRSVMVFPGLFITSLAVGPNGELYGADQHSSSLLRFDKDGGYETLIQDLPFGNASVAVDSAGTIYMGLPDKRIVRLEEDGSLSLYAALNTRSMVFGEDGALYAITGDYFQPHSLVRITGVEEYQIVATSIAGVPLGSNESQISSAPGGLYIVTEGTCNLFFTDFEGQGRLITNNISGEGGCLPVAMTSTPEGEIFFIAHNPYILLRIDPQGNAMEYAYSILGDPWDMAVSRDGKWLYVAEAGAIDAIPIIPANP